MYPTGLISVASRVLRDPLGEITLLTASILVTLFLVSPALAEDGTASVRMVHLSPDAPDVMVELDGEPVEALADVAYGDASPYLQIPAGPHEISVFATSDDAEPVLEVEISPEAGSSYTIAGTGLLSDDTFGARLFEDDDTKPEDGKSRMRVIHAIPDVGAATVSVEDGPELLALPGFGNASDYVEVEPDTYTLDVTPAGEEKPAFSVEDLSVASDKTYTAFAVGQALEGTVGAIVTDDSDDGKIVAVTGNAPNNTGVGTDAPTDASDSARTPCVPSASEKSAAAQKAVTAPETFDDKAKKSPSPKEKDEKKGKVSESHDVQSSEATKRTASAPKRDEQENSAVVETAVAPEPVATEPVVSESVSSNHAVTVVPDATVAQAVAGYVQPEIPAQAPVQAESVVQDITTSVYASVSQNTAVATSGSVIQSTTNVSVQNVAVEVVPETPTVYVPPVEPPVAPVAATVTSYVQQTVTQTTPTGGVPIEVPIQSVQAIVNTQAAVINSGARRRFVRGRW